MRYCYIISTCNKYLDTRVQYQWSTFLKHVDKKDIYYLTANEDLEKRQFGWGCLDDEKNITWKYINFIYNMDIPHYDWYVFIDDDTYVYSHKLEYYLKQYDPLDLFYIGNELDHVKHEYCAYMSGGAGYVISNGLYSLITQDIRADGPQLSFKHWCDDLCVGIWIDELIKKGHPVKQFHEPKFHINRITTNNEDQATAITFHHVFTQNDFNDVHNFADSTVRTAFVLVTDQDYFHKATRTIMDIRGVGNWKGEIVIITLDFDLTEDYKHSFYVKEAKFPAIHKTDLLEKIGPNGFSNWDRRELNKTNQWEKFHVFDDYFRTWPRIVFVDAGLRVLDDVKYILELDYKGKFVAPIDGRFLNPNLFSTQISSDKPEPMEALVNDFGKEIMDSTFFLNCIWVYDTAILDIVSKKEMIEGMNKYPCCKTNEMAIMNLYIHFKYGLWTPFCREASNGKILFDWCESNQTYNTTWKDYCFIKYPRTLGINDGPFRT